MNMADDADHRSSEGHPVLRKPPTPQECIARVVTGLTGAKDLVGIAHGHVVRARASGPTGLMNLFDTCPVIYVGMMSVALALLVALLVTRGPLEWAGPFPTSRSRRRDLRLHSRAVQTDLTQLWAGLALAMASMAADATRPTSRGSGRCRGCARLPGCISHTSPTVLPPSEGETLLRGRVWTLALAASPRRMSTATPPSCRAPT